MKRVLKATLRFLCGLLVLPFVGAWYLIAAIPGCREAAFRSCSECLSLLPGTLGVYLRFAFYRLVLKFCGDDACVSFGTVFSHPDVQLGRSVYIGHYCSIGDAVLGDDVLVASHVSIMNGLEQHGTSRLDTPVREQPGVFETVTIGQDTWIGERAVVAANVGRHCVVGAGAVVTRPLPDYAIAVGVPARVVADRREHSSGSGDELVADRPTAAANGVRTES